MNEAHVASRPPKRSRLKFLLIVVYLLMTFTLGVVGFREYYTLHCIVLGWGDLIYKSLNLFLVQFDIEHGPLPISLELARFLAFIAFAYALIKALASILSESFLRLRIQWQRRHAIVCSLSPDNLDVILDLRANGVTVVVIEADRNSPQAGRAIAAGAHLLVGNPADEENLLAANLKQAKYLLAMTPQDSDNIEIAYFSFNQRQQNPSMPPLQMVMHLKDSELMSVLSERPAFQKEHLTYRPRIVSRNKLSARWLLNEFGPDRYLNLNTLAERDLAIAIVGNSPLVGELVLRLAAIGYYGQTGRMKILLISESAEQTVEHLHKQRPSLSKLIELSAQKESLSVFNLAHSREYLHSFGAQMVYVCHDSSEKIMMSLQALEGLDIGCPVVISDSDNNKTNQQLQLEYKDSQDFHFTQLHQNFSRLQCVLYAHEDLRAKAIHENYRRTQLQNGDTAASNRSLVAWHILPETLKEANRNQADHQAIKCRLLTGKADCSVEEFSQALDASQIERLAIVEHQRWCANKYLDGWAHTEGKKDSRLRLSPSLIEWEALSDSERQKDRDAIANLPELIKLAEDNPC